MELDDLKNTWNAHSNTAQQQQQTRRVIDRVAATKYHSKIKKIAFPEILGSIICLCAAIYTGINFHILDTVFLQGTGILCTALLVVLPVISVLSIRPLFIKSDIGQPYAITLKNFALQQQRFYRLQKINLTLAYLLLVTVIILFAKFFGGTDITGNKYFWTFSFTLGYIFLLFFSKYVTRYYKKTLQQSGELLQELQ